MGLVCMPLSKWIPSRDAVLLSLLTMIIGGGIGWFTAAHFASEEMKLAVEEAKAEGRIAGIAEGNAEAQRAFESTAPARLEEMFGQVFEAIRNEARSAGFAAGREEGLRQGAESGRPEAFQEGYNLGFDDGVRNGYELGFSEGTSSQIEVASGLAEAERNWSAYSNVLSNLASLARELGELEGNLEGQQALLGIASAVVEVADTLREAHENQASAFNSIIDDLADAIERRDYERIREISLALEASTEAKGGVFLSAVKAALDQFASLRQQ